MSLVDSLRRSSRRSQSIFEMMLGAPSVRVHIHQGRHRKVAIFGGASLPIIDGHLIVHDEHGKMIAVCHEDLNRILAEMRV